MSDSPRYLIIPNVGPDVADSVLQVLRHGDRIVSVYPTSSQSHGGAIFLAALVELRHPSWAAENVGWCPGDPPLRGEEYR